MALPNGPYNPQENEAEMLNYWLENNFYKPEYSPKEDRILSTEEMKADIREAWALICPPPNAYARPHIGNISGYAYQDAMARYARMKGKKVLVLPGKDHAGLEGEGVFVREVLEKQGRNKFDMDREVFYKEMMEFFIKNIDIARNDEKAIGLSADFDRDTFTLDPQIVETVLDTFVEMYKDGRIYKGVRIVNWDPKARTAVADNQVEFKESQTPFFYFKYLIDDETNDGVKGYKLRSRFLNKEIQFNLQMNISKNDIDSISNEPQPDINYRIEDNQVKFVNLDEADSFEVYPIGYEDFEKIRQRKASFKDKDLNGTLIFQNTNNYKGIVVGIEQRIDKKYRLVVVNPENTREIKTLINEEYYGLSFSRYGQLPAGAHISIFSEKDKQEDYRDGFIIGTVRPETIFADTAIACDPKDERYKEFVGKDVEVEFLGEKKTLKFIADYGVDKDFGTGLLKVTPAHSVEDWEIAQRHPECLPAKQVIGYDLKLNHLTGKYNGMGIKEARKALQEDMNAWGNIVYIDEDYTNRIKIAERTKAPIEPLLSSQWYLKYDGIKEAAIEMVKNKGEKMGVTIHPENMEKKFFYWMENLRDWAISRSLWWGYRLPVWYAGEIFEEIDNNGQVKEFINLNGKKEELDYTNPNHLKVQKENPGEGWIQDENVLDTWFSSGQWVYATLTKHNLMDTFFPTEVLVSAHDILENWDSRMMMFTYFKHKNIPFKNLFLTGLVLGTDGQKMSKSKGNMIDMDKVRSEFGTDSVRMTYFYQNSAGASYSVTNDKLKNFKQFNNKIWNAAKFVLMNVNNTSSFNYQEPALENLNLENSKTILGHITEVKKAVTKNLEDYEFGHATDTLYHQFWHSFCDIYIESSKQYLNTIKDKESDAVISEPKIEDKVETLNVLIYSLKEYIKMLHPFIPFITERIWQELPKVEGDHKTVMYSKW